MRSLCFRLVTITSFSTLLVIGLSSNGNEETSPSVEDDMEGEDVIINKLQEDYRNTFSRVHGFLDSLSAVMERLNQRMESFETQLRQSSENMKAMNASLLTTIQRMEKVVTGGCMAKDLNSLDIFEYYRHAILKPIPSTGKSFNGSTLAEISSRIPTPAYPKTLTVEFANRLDSKIDSFQIKQDGENAVNLPPEQIPGNTKEAFTFQETNHYYSNVAFSYLIPDPTFRLVVYARSSYSGRAVGLAFLPSTVPISTYYSNPGSFGEFAELRDPPSGSEKTILAKKNGFIAKAILKDAVKAIDFPWGGQMNHVCPATPKYCHKILEVGMKYRFI